MAPWMIVVACISGPLACNDAGTPDLGVNSYTTRAQCEASMVQIAKNWNPGRGAFTFNCRQFPW